MPMLQGPGQLSCLGGTGCLGCWSLERPSFPGLSHHPLCCTACRPRPHFPPGQGLIIWLNSGMLIEQLRSWCVQDTLRVCGGFAVTDGWPLCCEVAPTQGLASPACFSPASLREKLGRVMEQRDGSPVRSRRQESVPEGQEGQDRVPAAPELPSDSDPAPSPVCEDRGITWGLSFL